MNKKKWKLLESETLIKLGFFQLKKEKCELPDGRVMNNYYVVDFSDWVQVVPVTSDHQIVMIKQYRHPGQDWFLEFPGGTTDMKGSEDPLLAAERELTEETGYVPGRIEKLGVHFPNPALQSNRLHSYIAWDCELTKEQNLDPYEDLEVVIMSPKEVIKAARSGRMAHSLMMASFVFAEPLLQEL